jgi:hypothetical protein
VYIIICLLNAFLEEKWLKSRSRGKLDKIMEGYENAGALPEEEGIITAIPKKKAEDLLEVIRNGMDRDRELYRHPTQRGELSQPLYRLQMS